MFTPLLTVTLPCAGCKGPHQGPIPIGLSASDKLFLTQAQEVLASTPHCSRAERRVKMCSLSDAGLATGFYPLLQKNFPGLPSWKSTSFTAVPIELVGKEGTLSFRSTIVAFHSAIVAFRSAKVTRHLWFEAYSSKINHQVWPYRRQLPTIGRRS